MKVGIARIVWVGALAGTLGLGVCGCAGSKKTSKKNEDQGATAATYSATLILPMQTNQMSLTDDAISSLEVTTFDSSGNQVSTSTTTVSTDADGISSAEIQIDPEKITAVEAPNKDLGVLIQATGKKPSASIQRPLTGSGKNVIDAIKSIPAEHRRFIDPEMVSTILPSGTKFDAASMTEIVVALTEKARELSEEKRHDIFLKRLELKTDYKEVAKARGNFDNAQAAEAFAARKAFITENPELAESKIVRFLANPSEVIEGDESLNAKIPESIRDKSSGEALARQILAKKVEDKDGKLEIGELAEMTKALGGVKAAVAVARRTSDGGSEAKMRQVIEKITERSTEFEKASDIEGQTLVAINFAEIDFNFFDQRRNEEKRSICTQVVVSLFNEKNGLCHDAMDGCEAGKYFNDGWRHRTRSDACANDTSSSGGNSGSQGNDGSDASDKICTTQVSELFEPRRGFCLMATDGCMIEEFLRLGWRHKQTSDICQRGSSATGVR
jgi:hypothetical protein